MRHKISLIGGVFLVFGLAATTAVEARQGEVVETFTCWSEMGDHIECSYRSRGQVTVHIKEQLGRNRCVLNENWGTFDGGVWVDYGCGAEFEVRQPPSGHASQSHGGDVRTVQCESMQRSYNMCRVDGIDPASVTIERRLNNSRGCEQGRSWGVSEGENAPPGIWVDKGCKAVFRYQVRGSSGGHHSSSHQAVNHGSDVDNACARAVAREVGVSPNDVMVTNSTVSEGTGRHVVYVGVPYGQADWVCEADWNGRVINVFYGGEG